MTTLFADLRFALRMLAKNPGFTLVVVVTLALGIGANSAMFGVIDATMLTPLPYGDAERLVLVRETTPDGDNFSASEPNYLDFRDGATTLAELAAFQDVSLTVAAGGEPARFDGMMVTPNFFTTLGIAPALGRTFVAAEGAPGAEAAVVVLGHDLWQQRFGGDAGIVGGTVSLEGRPYVVVGVTPSGFSFAGSALWTPLAPRPTADRGNHWLGMVGKLAPGVTVAQAQAELATVAARIGSDHPAIDGWGVRVTPLAEVIVRPQFRLTAYLLFGAVAFLLLMACANLASLLFARAARRETEMGIRTALGAGRGRLVRQMFVEVLVLAGLGIGAGLAVAHFAIVALQALAPAAIPRVDEIGLDGRVVAFTVGLGLLTSVLFGLAPALRASRANLNDVLKQGARGDVSRTRQHAGNTLVVTQVALAMVLLVGAGVLMRSFMQLQAADPGFDPTRVLATELQLGDRHAEPWQKVAFFAALTRRLEALPGIRSAGATATLPFSGSNFVNDLTPVELAAQTGPGGYLQANWRAVTPGFFDTMGLPLQQGRLFTADDPYDGPRLVVLSATLAQRLWPDESAVGKELYWGGTSGTPRIVAGVVGDYQDVEVGAPAPPVMFLPYNQLPWPKMTLLVRAERGVAGIEGVIREQVRALDPELVVPDIRPVSRQMSAAMAEPRFRTALLGVFAFVALLLAAVGVYGVMTYNVSGRTRELGLRIALGAHPKRIAGMLLFDGARLALAGLAAGLVGAWALTRFMQGLLYETAPLDGLALGTAVVLLGAIALTASWLPARRAAAIDPMVALRDE